MSLLNDLQVKDFTCDGQNQRPTPPPPSPSPSPGPGFPSMPGQTKGAPPPPVGRPSPTQPGKK